jgi:hypothetical protein
MFNSDLQLEEEKIWTLTNPRLPEIYFSHVPADIMDEIRVALAQCSAQQMWILKVMAVVGGSDCPIFLLEELLEDAVLSVSQLEDDMGALVEMGIIETTVVKAIKAVDKTCSLDMVLAAAGGGNTKATDEKPTTCYLTYTFINVHCQTACYNMLSFSRRQELHESIAKWYEEKLGLEEEISDDDDEEERLPNRRGRATQIKASYKLDSNFGKISKKYACFLVHHHFMSSTVDKAVAICNMIGAIELQVYCGQYARKVLTQLPPNLNDAILARIYPCIRWMQGVSSVINAMKKGKVGFGAITAGKMMSNKLHNLRNNNKGGGKPADLRPAAVAAGAKTRNESVMKLMTKAAGTGIAALVGGTAGRVSLLASPPSGSAGRASPVGFATPAAKPAAAVNKRRASAKITNYASAYGGKTAATKAVTKVKNDDVLSNAAAFSGISWQSALKSTTAKLRSTFTTKLHVANVFALGVKSNETDGPNVTAKKVVAKKSVLSETTTGGSRPDNVLKFGNVDLGSDGSKTSKLFAAFHGKKKSIAMDAETAMFWKPTFDAEKAIAEGDGMSSTGSAEGDSSKDDFSPAMQGYINTLQSQQSKRLIATQRSSRGAELT